MIERGGETPILIEERERHGEGETGRQRQTDRQAGRETESIGRIVEGRGGRWRRREREGGRERGSGKLRERDREISMISDHG